MSSNEMELGVTGHEVQKLTDSDGADQVTGSATAFRSQVTMPWLGRPSR